jgi:hypothetical protein
MAAPSEVCSVLVVRVLSPLQHKDKDAVSSLSGRV